MRNKHIANIHRPENATGEQLLLGPRQKTYQPLQVLISSTKPTQTPTPIPALQLTMGRLFLYSESCSIALWMATWGESASCAGILKQVAFGVFQLGR